MVRRHQHKIVALSVLATATIMLDACDSSAPSARRVDRGAGVVGDTLKTGSGNQFTVFVYERPAAGLTEPAEPRERGGELAAIEVQACAGPHSKSLDINPFEFTLDLAGSQEEERSPTDLAIPVFKEPSLVTADTEDLASGQCARGWLVYEIPEGQQPRSVVYESVSGPAILRWRLL